MRSGTEKNECTDCTVQPIRHVLMQSYRHHAHDAAQWHVNSAAAAALVKR
jgi:hypothetical protein